MGARGRQAPTAHPSRDPHVNPTFGAPGDDRTQDNFCAACFRGRRFAKWYATFGQHKTTRPNIPATALKGPSCPPGIDANNQPPRTIPHRTSFAVRLSSSSSSPFRRMDHIGSQIHIPAAVRRLAFVHSWSRKGATLISAIFRCHTALQRSLQPAGGPDFVLFFLQGNSRWEDTTSETNSRGARRGAPNSLNSRSGRATRRRVKSVKKPHPLLVKATKGAPPRPLTSRGGSATRRRAEVDPRMGGR